MTASLFNDKSRYALKLGNEPVMREVVSSLFALINDYVLLVPNQRINQPGSGGKRRYHVSGPELGETAR